MHNFYYANIFIDFSNIYCWTFPYLPLDYYLSTCYDGSFFVLAYLCRRYFWGLIIIFVGCNLDFEQNGPLTLYRQPLDHVPSVKLSLGFDSSVGDEKCPQHLYNLFSLLLKFLVHQKKKKKPRMISNKMGQVIKAQERQATKRATRRDTRL